MIGEKPHGSLSTLYGFVFTFILCQILAVPAFAREDIIPGSRYTSARSAGMGDAFLPLVDDAPTSLFFNPAGLAKIRKTDFEPFNLAFYGNSPYVATIDSRFLNVTSLPSFTSTLDRVPGQFTGGGGSFLIGFGLPGFGVAVLGQAQLGAQRNADNTITYRSLYQIIPTIGGAFRLAHGIIRIGYSFQWVNQASGNPTVATAVGYNDGIAQGSGFSHNAGVTFTVPMPSLPAINLVARNILNMPFNPFMLLPIATNSTGAPSTEPMTFDGSVSFQPRLGQGAIMNVALVYRDMTNQSGVHFIGHFALGVEFALKDTVFVRGGFGSGYPAAGFGIKRKSSELSLSWYSEEIGTGYLNQRDIRFMFQYQLRAF